MTPEEDADINREIHKRSHDSSMLAARTPPCFVRVLLLSPRAKRYVRGVLHCWDKEGNAIVEYKSDFGMTFDCLPTGRISFDA